MKIDKNKVAVVVGGSSGIGKATTQKLVSEGVRVVVLGRDKRKLDQMMNMHEWLVEVAECDIRNEDSVVKVFTHIEKKYKKINFLINCAGTSESKSLIENSSEGFSNDLDTNLKGPFLCVLHSYKFIATGGSIVNVSSIRARTGTPSGLAYAASKAAIINLTKSLSIQLAIHNIRVNCVVPGAVYPTGMSQKWDEKKIFAIAKEIPLKRLAAPDDIANAICFFTSDDSSYITGQTLDINGGQWMG